MSVITPIQCGKTAFENLKKLMAVHPDPVVINKTIVSVHNNHAAWVKHICDNPNEMPEDFNESGHDMQDDLLDLVNDSADVVLDAHWKKHGFNVYSL